LGESHEKEDVENKEHGKLGDAEVLATGSGADSEVTTVPWKAGAAILPLTFFFTNI